MRESGLVQLGLFWASGRITVIHAKTGVRVVCVMISDSESKEWSKLNEKRTVIE